MKFIRNIILKDYFIIIIIFVLFSFLYSILSVTRHNHFQSQGIDFSIYDQALWLYSNFDSPLSTVTNRLDLGDRFRPIMLLISPIYWIFENERILLIFQSTILSAAIFPIWLIAKKYLDTTLAILVSFIFINSIGIQSAVVADFHEMAVLPVLLGWLFYFLISKKWKYYFIFLVLTLAVREHVGFLLSTLSIYIYLAYKNVTISIVTALISLIWSITSIKVIMPFFGQDNYSSFVQSGDTLQAAVTNYLKSPISIVNNLFFPTIKIQTVFFSFLNFGLLPILYFPLMFPVLFNFSSRFLDQLHPIRWTLFWHYSLELTVLLTIATIFSLEFIMNRFKIVKNLSFFILLYLFTVHFISNIILDIPLKNLLKVQFYEESIWMTDTKSIIKLIPKDASVSSQNNLLPHLSHRNEIYLLPKVNDAEYIVVDLHPGQNDWNFYTYDREQTIGLISQLVSKKKV